MSDTRRWMDGLLEASVVLSFTRAGPAMRRKLDAWSDPEPDALAGKHIVLTGGTSGIGARAAEQVVDLGASLTLIARDEGRGRRAVEALRGRRPGATVDLVMADMGELADVRRACEELLATHPVLHGLVHNAGALDDVYGATREGIEHTVATHLVGPHLMSTLLEPALLAGAPARVVWVSSGGMYAEPLSVDRLEMTPREYDGVIAYARAKRAQVALVAEIAGELSHRGIVVQAMHPGWVDTPGVERSLPTFRRVVGPMLRTTDDGADTIVYLLTADEPMTTPGRLWLDRRPRPLHRWPGTLRSDTPGERARLLTWLHHRAGLASV